jgi:uncharacterized protein involved in exopolysaccharide biosynthesis
MATEISLHSARAKDGAATAPQSDAQAGSEDGSLSLLDLLLLLTEQKRVLLGVTAGFIIMGIIISFIMPTTYTATVVLLPPQQNQSLSTVLNSQLGGVGGVAALAAGGLGLKNPNEMFIAMLQSRIVEDSMIERYGLMTEYHSKYLSSAQAAFEHVTTIKGDLKDGLIHISIEDRNPQRAAELANGYVEQFRKLSANMAITEASQRRLFFEQQMEDAKNNLANSEEAMKKTEQTTGLIELDSQARALISSAAGLRGEIAAKQVQIQVMRTYATSENADLEQAQEELSGLRIQLAKLGGSEDTADSLIVPKGKVPESGLEYVRRLRDVKYYETIFEIIAKQWESAKLDEAREGALIQVVDPAIVPDRRSSPKRKLIVILATVVGLFVGTFVALLLSALKRSTENPETRRKLAELRRGWPLLRRNGSDVAGVQS